MTLTQALINELRHEGSVTEAVLERVPEDRFSWKPHEKSRSLGELAVHVAGTPMGIAQLLDADEAPPPSVPETVPATREELLAIHRESIQKADETLESWGDDRLRQEWRMVAGEQTLMAQPRIAMVRSLMMNHLYHHRGQLSVYLRLLDIPVPPIYGPSADENPFG